MNASFAYSISPEIRTDEQRKQDNANWINALWLLSENIAPKYDGHLLDSIDALVDDRMLEHYEKADAEWPCETCHGYREITVGRGENVWSEDCPECGVTHAQRS